MTSHRARCAGVCRGVQTHPAQVFDLKNNGLECLCSLCRHLCAPIRVRAHMREGKKNTHPITNLKTPCTPCTPCTVIESKEKNLCRMKKKPCTTLHNGMGVYL